MTLPESLDALVAAAEQLPPDFGPPVSIEYAEKYREMIDILTPAVVIALARAVKAAMESPRHELPPAIRSLAAALGAEP